MQLLRGSLASPGPASIDGCRGKGYGAIEPDNLDSWSRSTGLLTASDNLAVAEECQVYTECDGYTRVYGTQVIEIEYTDNPRKAFTQACAARGSRISVILRDRDVLPRGHSGYTYSVC